MGRRAVSRQCKNNKSKINKRKTQSITLIWLYLPNIRYRFWFLWTLEWSWCLCHSCDWFCIDMSCMRVSVCGFVYLYERWFHYFFFVVILVFCTVVSILGHFNGFINRNCLRSDVYFAIVLQFTIANGQTEYVGEWG